MSETQFYISVAVMPVTTIIIVLIGVLLNNSRFNDISGRFNDIGSRFAEINSRLSALESTFTARLNDQREMLRSEIARVESVLLAKFAELDSRLSRLEAGVR